MLRSIEQFDAVDLLRLEEQLDDGSTVSFDNKKNDNTRRIDGRHGKYRPFNGAEGIACSKLKRFAGNHREYDLEHR